MKKLKSTLAATLLSLALTITASAGNISSPGVTDPPPPPPSSAEGNISSPGSPVLVEILLAVLSWI
jgi:hypothetical protein